MPCPDYITQAEIRFNKGKIRIDSPDLCPDTLTSTMKGFLTIIWLLPALAVAQLGTGVETPDGSCQ